MDMRSGLAKLAPPASILPSRYTCPLTNFKDNCGFQICPQVSDEKKNVQCKNYANRNIYIYLSQNKIV